jgi:caa(3)-type oxidase subunit IV
MSEPHATPGHSDADHGAGHDGHISDKTFIKVFGALLVCTAISFGVNQFIGSDSPAANFILIGIIATLKAILVVVYFMHMLMDWKKLFIFIVPVLVLAPMVIIVLWPDIVHGWRSAGPP